MLGNAFQSNPKPQNNEKSDTTEIPPLAAPLAALECVIVNRHEASWWTQVVQGYKRGKRNDIPGELLSVLYESNEALLNFSCGKKKLKSEVLR